MGCNNRMKMIEELYNVLNQWMFLNEKEIKLDDMLKKLDISKIIIYGMGSMAVHIMNQLKNTDVDVVAIMDSCDNYAYENCKFLNVKDINSDLLNSIDAIVVTTSFIDDDVKIKLQQLCKIIFLSDIIFENIYEE